MNIVCEARVSPALNVSSAIWRFERSNAIEIRNGIILDFYTGLPQFEYIIQRGIKIHSWVTLPWDTVDQFTVLCLGRSYPVSLGTFVFFICSPHKGQTMLTFAGVIAN